jgi:hypothetical protein
VENGYKIVVGKTLKNPGGKFAYFLLETIISKQYFIDYGNINLSYYLNLIKNWYLLYKNGITLLNTIFLKSS